MNIITTHSNPIRNVKVTELFITKITYHIYLGLSNMAATLTSLYICSWSCSCPLSCSCPQPTTLSSVHLSLKKRHFR